MRAERELGDIIRTQSAQALALEADPAKRVAIYKATSEPLKVVSWPHEPSGYLTLVLGQLLPASGIASSHSRVGDRLLDDERRLLNHDFRTKPTDDDRQSAE